MHRHGHLVGFDPLNPRRRADAALPPTPATTTFQYQPGGLYNGLVAPVLPYAIRGVLWYQDESNTSHPADYYALTSSLIMDWRAHFQRPALPFLYVQLANINAARPAPGESNQALAAEKVAYGDAKIVASGPLYQAMKTAGHRASLTFGGVGGGLVARGGGPLAGFTVAGADRKFVPALARIEGGRVLVWSDQVAAPVAVRYAWADNPAAANLYNKESLPASTFRTDDY